MSLAVVTGSTTGIGRDLAKLCAGAGYKVVAVGRNEGQLESLRTEIGAQTVALDLSEPGAAKRVVEALGGEPVDILINNAGVGMRGFFHELDVEQQMAMLRLNVDALTHLTALVLPGIVARNSGRVMNVASTAAFQPGPLMAVYYATKAYVLSLSEALHNEVADKGVTVTALCPGPTATEFGNRAQMDGTKLFAGSTMTSAEVARVGFEAMMAGRSTVIPGTKNRVFALRLG